MSHQTAIELALTAQGVRHQGGVRHPDGTSVTQQEIRALLEGAGFYDLVDQIRQLVEQILAKLVEGGMPAEMIDREVRAQVNDWALVAGLVQPAPPPPAQTSTRRPWVRRMFTERDRRAGSGQGVQ